MEKWDQYGQTTSDKYGVIQSYFAGRLKDVATSDAIGEAEREAMEILVDYMRSGTLTGEALRRCLNTVRAYRRDQDHFVEKLREFSILERQLAEQAAGGPESLYYSQDDTQARDILEILADCGIGRDLSAADKLDPYALSEPQTLMPSSPRSVGHNGNGNGQ